MDRDILYVRTEVFKMFRVAYSCGHVHRPKTCRSKGVREPSRLVILKKGTIMKYTVKISNRKYYPAPASPKEKMSLWR